MNSKQVKLKEYLYPKMDILFLALNAPEVSNSNGHWISRNLSFWNLLYDAGLITERIFTPTTGDIKVFGGNSINLHSMVYGVTDLNRDVVETDSRLVAIESIHVQRIVGILETCKVKRMSIMHSAVAKAFEETGLISRNNRSGGNEYGVVGTINGTIIYEVPFHNATIPGKVILYKKLIEGILPNKETTKKSILIQAEPEIKAISVKPKQPSNVFYLPEGDNKITSNDINSGVLRLTAGAKTWFPQEEGYVEIIYKSSSKLIIHTPRIGRSDLLKMGKDVVKSLGLREGNVIKFTRLGKGKFLLEKV